MSADGPGLGDDLWARLHRLAAEGAVDEAADERRRRHWQVRAAEEGSTLAGVLVDLAERRGNVVLTTTAASTHHGAVVAVGADLVVLAGATGLVLVRAGAVASVRPAPGTPASMGDRPPVTAVAFTDALGSWAAERASVALCLTGGATVEGELWWVGVDVAAVRGDDGVLTYVAVDRVVVATGPTGSTG